MFVTEPADTQFVIVIRSFIVSKKTLDIKKKIGKYVFIRSGKIKKKNE